MDAEKTTPPVRNGVGGAVVPHQKGSAAATATTTMPEADLAKCLVNLVISLGKYQHGWMAFYSFESPRFLRNCPFYEEKKKVNEDELAIVLCIGLNPTKQLQRRAQPFCHSWMSSICLFFFNYDQRTRESRVCLFFFVQSGFSSLIGAGAANPKEKRKLNGSRRANRSAPRPRLGRRGS